MNWHYRERIYNFKLIQYTALQIWRECIGMLIISILTSSCSVEENHTVINTEETYISFEGLKLRSGNTHQGDGEDYIVQTFRILAFNGSGACVSNTHYNAIRNETIKHTIEIGTYDFVFLANEAENASIKTQLDNLGYYTELNAIAFPASAFASDTLIPMMQEIKDVEVLKNGNAKIAGTAVATPIKLELDRIGARIDVLLKAVEDLDAIFTGVTFSNLPDKVPLTANYNGTVNRNLTRSFTLSGNSDYFSDTTVVESGIVWAKNVARIIVPSNEFTPVDNKNNAMVFTVNLEGKYNPYCELKIASSDYSIPRNTKLDLLGTVKMPLDMNIKAEPWIESNNTWTPDNRILNVSQIEAEITDFNGVRISFSSNMPKVRVLPQVYIEATNAVTETNTIFNDLAITDGTNSTNRFSYDPTTGSGYMDVLVDDLNSPGNYIYRLVLSAEDENGNNQLQREIKIKIAQTGWRFKFDRWGFKYIGAFFRNNEKGERVITGQHSLGLQWSATVKEKVGDDFIIISSTPSFDPDIGTNKPGDPELFPVEVNKYKNESGKYIVGKGRIYFRVGTKSSNTGMPRYAVIEVRHHPDGNPDYQETETIYIRQGEQADYVFEPDADIITSGDITIIGNNREYARKFSPYNLTAQAFKNGSTQPYVQIPVNGAVFVDYPSQAGAYFQWGMSPSSSFYATNIRLAYHPTLSDGSNLEPNGFTSDALWNPATGYKYKTDCEVCPGSYYRPSDGYTDSVAVNDNYAGNGTDPPVNNPGQIKFSNFRLSLLKSPYAGNAYSEPGRPSTYPTSKLEGTTLPGYYADGFFDRYPVNAAAKAVSTNNANVAYRGTLFFNPRTNASLFIPSSGRIETGKGLDYQGDSGYFWSSSVAPKYSLLIYGVWGFETGYWNVQPVSSVGSFGHSIRCVTD